MLVVKVKMNLKNTDQVAGTAIAQRIGVHSQRQLVLVGAAASFRDGHFDMQNMRKVSFVRFADFRVSAEMGTLSSHRGALGN